MKKITAGLLLFILLPQCFLFPQEGVTGYIIGAKNTGDYSGTGYDFSRERNLLEQLGEYERREASRIARERKN
ncbi:MAG: hypothetical protein LBU88_07375 [Treponema sp.]|nr:hypothetical protein [Treponema sp.]